MIQFNTTYTFSMQQYKREYSQYKRMIISIVSKCYYLLISLNYICLNTLMLRLKSLIIKDFFLA